MCANFQTKRTSLTFLAQICPKRNLGLEIQKTNVRIRISNLEIPCVLIFRQNGQLWIFRPKFGEIAQLRAILWFEYCWECCRELGRSWNELSGGGWSWVEVDGAEWSWVHGLLISIWKGFLKKRKGVLENLRICLIGKSFCFLIFFAFFCKFLGVLQVALFTVLHLMWSVKIPLQSSKHWINQTFYIAIWEIFVCENDCKYNPNKFSYKFYFLFFRS